MKDTHKPTSPQERRKLSPSATVYEHGDSCVMKDTHKPTSPQERRKLSPSATVYEHGDSCVMKDTHKPTSPQERRKLSPSATVYEHEYSTASGSRASAIREKLALGVPPRSRGLLRSSTLLSEAWTEMAVRPRCAHHPSWGLGPPTMKRGCARAVPGLPRQACRNLLPNTADQSSHAARESPSPLRVVQPSGTLAMLPGGMAGCRSTLRHDTDGGVHSDQQAFDKKSNCGQEWSPEIAGAGEQRCLATHLDSTVKRAQALENLFADCLTFALDRCFVRIDVIAIGRRRMCAVWGSFGRLSQQIIDLDPVELLRFF